MSSLVRSVNVARELVERPYASRPTGIGKMSTDEPVEVREPGPKHGGLGSGLVGDRIGDQRHHGGTNQAIYAFSREVLDEWQARLGRELPDGSFGENLTTAGLDVDGARLGERWRIGSDVVLQVTEPRIPCNTFRGHLNERGWLKTFTADARCGAYLKIVEGGTIRRGDPVEIIERPDHDVTMSIAFRALMGERALLPTLLDAGPHLTDELRRSALGQ